ncbi:hypothetical protein HDU97_002067 [Phlyctochytrium planicorne]|nr:hypothetical protein HDU97_002067 [Phlyctochytrium planicorne]
MHAEEIPPEFKLESSQLFSILPNPVELQVYKHASSDLRVVLAPISGPLCSLTILVPTQSIDDAGHPHTLEHLVFCGSKAFPERGFLDTLATRCLSSGSNAYTAEDHTAYTITTAGSEGMMEMLPVFMDHVLEPLLTNEQFVTEVYHVDGQGKEQGVVFCEMAGREQTEMDVLDLTIRRLLYKDTTYSLECGGLTPEIRKLTNGAIRRYHRSQYHIDNVTVVLCGIVDPGTTLSKLLGVNAVKNGTLTKSESVSDPMEVEPSPIDIHPLPETVSEAVIFPSSDEEVGTIAYAWRGPTSESVKDIFALEIMLRYLQNNSSSPLNQAFVEIPVPWASSVDFDVKTFVTTGLTLYFSGVPCTAGSGVDDDGDSAWETSEEEEDGVDGDSHREDEDEEMDGLSEDGDAHEDDGEDDEEDNRDLPDVDLFSPNVFKTKLMEVLGGIAQNGIAPSQLHMTIRRLRRKILEAGEEDPHELAMGYLLPDILRYHLSPRSILGDSRRQIEHSKNGTAAPRWGIRGQALAVLDELDKEPTPFWADLAKKYFVGPPFVEVFAIPSKKLAKQNSAAEEAALKERKERLGKDGLEECRKRVEKAIKANEVNLSDKSLSALPKVPNLASLAKVQRKVWSGSGALEGVSRTPFSSLLTVETETAFTSIRMGFNSGSIPEQYKPFLVLFQELIFESSLQIPKASGGFVDVDYQEVVRRCFESFVSYESAFGFGNDLWSATWLSEVFMLAASLESEHLFGPNDYESNIVGAEFGSGTVLLLIQSFLFTHFTPDRIQVAIRKLQSDLTETKRDGGSMLSAAGGRIMNPKGSNEVFMSVFRQERFLKEILAAVKEGGDAFKAKVVMPLEAIRDALVLNTGGEGLPGFLQVATPLAAKSSDVLDKTLALWRNQVQVFETMRSANGGLSTGNVQTSSAVASAFPFPRQPFSMDLIDQTFSKSIVLPVAGITASYFSVTVPCNVLKAKDYFAVSLLADLLSRMEGPLYTSIRGRGLAYDATMHLALWTGQLSFEVHESTDPRGALVELYKILLDLADDDGFKKLAADVHLETARASVAYRIVESRSTAKGVVSAGLRSALRGFASLDEEEDNDQNLYSVTAADVKAAFWKYYWQFMDPSRINGIGIGFRRVVVLVTPEGEGVAPMVKSFSADPKIKVPESVKGKIDNSVSFGVKLKKVGVKDLTLLR